MIFEQWQSVDSNPRLNCEYEQLTRKSVILPFVDAYRTAEITSQKKIELVKSLQRLFKNVYAKIPVDDVISKKTFALIPMQYLIYRQMATKQRYIQNVLLPVQFLCFPPLKYNGDGLVQQQESNVLMTKPNNNECKICQSNSGVVTYYKTLKPQNLGNQ